jgi:hypothetical protein
MDRLFKAVEDRIKADWGPAFAKLGPELQAAVRAQGVLFLLDAQDEGIEVDRLRAIIEEGSAWAYQAKERGLS